MASSVQVGEIVRGLNETTVDGDVYDNIGGTLILDFLNIIFSTLEETLCHVTSNFTLYLPDFSGLWIKGNAI